MDQSNQNRNKWVPMVLIGLVAGLVLGLVYAYLINPVEWVEAPLSLTRTDLQEDYLRMAIDSYKLYYDPTAAYQRWMELGEAGPNLLLKVIASPQAQGIETVSRFRDLVAPNLLTNTSVCPEVAAESSNSCLYLWLGTVIVGGGAGVYFYTRLRRQIEGSSRYRYPQPKAPTKVDKPITIPYVDKPVLVHTMMTYVMGDDLFDESISVETDEGDFLGECGVGIVNTLDEELPKKVNAFDLWLFDKSEINTLSVVVLTPKAYHDDIVLTKLRNKGEPILAEIGREIILKTSFLVMVVRIVDIECEEMDLNRCSFFQRLSMEIFVRQLV